MNIQDACKILGLSGAITKEAVKMAYRRACMQYHPDRNPSGEHMMKMVNAAYAVLEDYEGEADVEEHAADYGEALNRALNAIAGLGFDIEVCGAWIWLTGDTRPYKELLKQQGFRWAPKKLRWFYRPEDYKSHSRGKWSMDQIRDKYGSDKVAPWKSERPLLSD